MAKTLNYESEIANTLVIKSEHIKQSVDAFTGVDAYDITLSGSLEITGSVSTIGNLIIGSANTTTNTYSATIAGSNNNNCGYRSVILGGCENIISAQSCSLALSGDYGNSVIMGGKCNEISTPRGNNSILGGYSNEITGSNPNENSNSYSNSILGGNRNCINSDYDGNVIVGGKENNIIGAGVSAAAILGSAESSVTGNTSIVLGGSLNTVSGAHSLTSGDRNTVSNDYSSAFGKDITTNKDCTTFVNNLNITGSITSNGVLNLSLRVTTPFPLSAGDIWRSGSSSDNNLYFSPNGSAICQIAFV